jgi:hypothetical protein
VDFSKTEVVFYIAVSVSGLIGGVIRLCIDNISYGIIGNIGRCLSAGLVSFGIVGIWIGHDSSGIGSPFYYLAASALIGYVGHDLQDKIFNRAIGVLLNKIGLTEPKKKEKEGE